MWALSDARTSRSDIARNASGTEVNLREVAVAASIISAGIALSVVVRVDTVREKASQADIVGAAGRTRVQAHLADSISTSKHEVSKARGADIGRGALKTVGNVAYCTLSIY